MSALDVSDASSSIHRGPVIKTCATLGGRRFGLLVGNFDLEAAFKAWDRTVLAMGRGWCPVRLARPDYLAEEWI